METRPIQSLWIGNSLSIVEKLSINSFLMNGHDFHLYTYGVVDNVPAGTVVLDAREICDFDPEIKIDSGFGQGSYAPFSDYFRFQLLMKKGGWWVDLDVICLQSFQGLPEALIATSYEVPEGDLANCNVLSFPADHWFLNECIEFWKNNVQYKLHYAFGVEVVKFIVAKHNAYYLLAPHEVFNPISWRHVQYLLQQPEPVWKPIGLKRRLGLAERIGSITPNSRAIHLWNEGWRRGGFKKDVDYESNSIFEKLKHRYLYEFSR